MRGAARAAEITEEKVALEKSKGLAEKAAARKAATGQAGKVKRVSEEAARKAETGQAGKVKRLWEEAKRVSEESFSPYQRVRSAPQLAISLHVRG